MPTGLICGDRNIFGIALPLLGARGDSAVFARAEARGAGLAAGIKVMTA